jgi:hypothetical protein
LLIIVFIVFAFFGIKKFLGIRDEIISKKFISDLNSDIEKLWKSSRGSREVSYTLPRKITQICINNSEKDNIYFIPNEFDPGTLKNLNIQNTLKNKKWVCFSVENKKINLVLSKDYTESLVTVSGKQTTQNNQQSSQTTQQTTQNKQQSSQTTQQTTQNNQQSSQTTQQTTQNNQEVEQVYSNPKTTDLYLSLTEAIQIRNY